MRPIYSTDISTVYGEKQILVYNGDILDFCEPIDILTTSAYKGCYHPTPGTVFAALHHNGISVLEHSQYPEIDLRKLCNVWLSKEITNHRIVGRIGCVEMGRKYLDDHTKVLNEQGILYSLKAYFQMLDIAATYSIKMDTVAMPLLGAGSQQISAALTMIPIVNECASFLRRNPCVKRICFIERNPEKAELIAQTLRNSYALLHEQVDSPSRKVPATGAKAFISYASPDKNIADNLCAKLESRGVKVWYAPRDVQGPYAAAIVEGIRSATHFVVILSQNSMASQHVLNEIDLAFQGLPDKIKFKPLRIDDSLFSPSFAYYLSRQHWMDAIIPPLEARLEEFVAKLMDDL